MAQGDTDEAMYLILEDWVRIVRTVANQPPLELARLGPLSSFGEMAFLTSCPRTASATAETTIWALSLTRTQAKRLWTEDPQLVLSFYQTLTQALTHSLSHIERFPTSLPHT